MERRNHLSDEMKATLEVDLSYHHFFTVCSPVI